MGRPAQIKHRKDDNPSQGCEESVGEEEEDTLGRWVFVVDVTRGETTFFAKTSVQLHRATSIQQISKERRFVSFSAGAHVKTAFPSISLRFLPFRFLSKTHPPRKLPIL